MPSIAAHFAEPSRSDTATIFPNSARNIPELDGLSAVGHYEQLFSPRPKHLTHDPLHGSHPIVRLKQCGHAGDPLSRSEDSSNTLAAKQACRGASNDARDPRTCAKTPESKGTEEDPERQAQDNWHGMPAAQEFTTDEVTSRNSGQLARVGGI